MKRHRLPRRSHEKASPPATILRKGITCDVKCVHRPATILRKGIASGDDPMKRHRLLRRSYGKASPPATILRKGIASCDDPTKRYRLLRRSYEKVSPPAMTSYNVITYRCWQALCSLHTVTRLHSHTKNQERSGESKIGSLPSSASQSSSFWFRASNELFKMLEISAHGPP